MNWYKRLARWHHNYRLMKRQSTAREKLLEYLSKPGTDKEKKALRPFFERHCFEMLPYFWVDETHYLDVEVFHDSSNDLHYVNWKGHRMYWKRGGRPWFIRKSVHALQMEQDDRSPHKYVVDDSIEGAVLADFGAAEGCFVLSVIDRIKHAYLFECDDGWIEALRATFRPWQDKITIVNKFIGNHLDEKTTTVDDYFSDKELDYVKADIEGAELNMLQGGENVFRHKVREINLCVYHRPTDAGDIQKILSNFGYHSQLTQGFLFVFQDKDKPETWLRKGVIFGKRV